MSLQNGKEQGVLADIGIGERVRILELQFKGTYRRRLLDLGLIPGTEVTAVMKSPLGNPIAYEIRGSLIALRREDASKIMVKRENEKEKERN
jgi:ferrous iron transport protein A